MASKVPKSTRETPERRGSSSLPRPASSSTYLQVPPNKIAKARTSGVLKVKKKEGGSSIYQNLVKTLRG